MVKRDPALEIFRGIAICEVVLHHVSGFARTNVQPGTPSQLFYAVLNRTLHFAVPAFLLLMGVLLTISMLDERRTWKEFYSRRARQTLVPFLLWTVIYALFQLWIGKTTPSAILSAESWIYWLTWGKAWYHLYFLVLALQLYILFPLILGAVGRSRLGLPALLALSAAIQIAFYCANRWWLKSPHPSSLLAWHVIPVVAGVWIGLHYASWDLHWRRLRPLALFLTVVGLAVYLPLGLRELKGLPLDTFTYQLSLWAYTIGVSFCLVAFCRFLARSAGGLARGLQALGMQSMQIYLVHPLILWGWYCFPQTGSTLQYHATVALAAVSALGLSLLVSRLATRVTLGRILFGRGDVPMAALPSRKRGPAPSPACSPGAE